MRGASGTFWRTLGLALLVGSVAGAANARDQSPLDEAFGAPAARDAADAGIGARPAAAGQAPEVAAPLTVPPGVEDVAAGTPAPATAAPSGTPSAPPDARAWGPWRFLGVDIGPGERRDLELPLGGASTDDAGLPVTVVRGSVAGPTLCLTSAVHGDEINGIEIIGRVTALTRPTKLRGTLIGVPIVNLPGFRRGSRYLPDRRDLNRFFPGNARGSLASRLARAVFDGVIQHCEALADFHAGSFHRTNLPQVRGDLRDPKVLELALAFGAPVILFNEGGPGTIRRAATDVGIPAILYEAGEPMRVDDEEVERGIAGVRGLMRGLGMLDGVDVGPVAPPPIYHGSRWVRADSAGILRANVLLGSEVHSGDVLATVFDPIAGERQEVVSPVGGRVIGKALDQFVVPGFAVFHIAESQASGSPPPVGSPPAPVEDEELDAAREGPHPLEADERPE